jgi:hypothetical protein
LRSTRGLPQVALAQIDIGPSDRESFRQHRITKRKDGADVIGLRHLVEHHKDRQAPLCRKGFPVAFPLAQHLGRRNSMPWPILHFISRQIILAFFELVTRV